MLVSVSVPVPALVKVPIAAALLVARSLMTPAKRGRGIASADRQSGARGGQGIAKDHGGAGIRCGQ